MGIARFAFLSSFLVLAPHAFGGTIVAPNTRTSVAGNDDSGAFPSFVLSGRFQEGIAPGQFNSLTGPVYITGLSYRADPGFGPFNLNIGSLSVFLSTSPNFPNSVGHPLLSETFANNIGPNNTLVFSGSNVTWSDAGCAGPAPCPFDLNLMFTTPFLYNPMAGSLLIDQFWANALGTSGRFDVEQFSAPGGSVGTVNGELGSLTGDVEYSSNVVQLTYTAAAAVPEPASGLLLMAGIVLIGVRARSSAKVL